MAAHQKVTTEVLLEAVRRWHGNVAGAAHEIGLAPKNVRERLARHGYSLEAIRAGSTNVPNVPARIGTNGTVGNETPDGTHGRKSSIGTIAEKVLRPSFSAMTNAAAAEAVTPREVKDQKPVRVHPEHQEELRKLVIDFAAQKGLETDRTAALFAVLEWSLPRYRAAIFGDEQ